MNKKIHEIRHASAKIRIGKKGLTENIVKEVDILLQKDRCVKIKCLKIVPKESIKPIANNIARLTSSNVVEVRGKTFILKK